MNTSRKTKIIANGIALCAAYQDLPIGEIAGSKAEENWRVWQQTHPQWVRVRNARTACSVRPHQRNLLTEN